MAFKMKGFTPYEKNDGYIADLKNAIGQLPNAAKTLGNEFKRHGKNLVNKFSKKRSPNQTGNASPVYTTQENGKTNYHLNNGNIISKQKYLSLQKAWNNKKK